jgi:N-carbamoylputrescine amidase
MLEQVTTAAVAFDARPGELPENLERISEWCRRAAKAGAELVLFPELSLSGFIPNHPAGDHAAWMEQVLRAAWRGAEPMNGPAVAALAEISRETGVYLAAGMLESAGNVLYNTHVLVGEGRVLARWRKMHIPLFEMQVYNGGGPAQVVETALGRIGVNICFDTFLPESTRLLGVQNAEIGLFPFAADPPPPTPAGWADWARTVLQARCAENGLFGVACNYFGPVAFAGVEQCFPGGAMTLDPAGRVSAAITEAENGPHMLVSTLRRDELLEARARFEYTFRFRRPELYKSLAATIADNES